MVMSNDKLTKQNTGKRGKHVYNVPLIVIVLIIIFDRSQRNLLIAPVGTHRLRDEILTAAAAGWTAVVVVRKRQFLCRHFLLFLLW